MTSRGSRVPLPPWVRRLLYEIVAVVVVVFVAYHVFRALRSLIIILVISLFISIALEPGVNFLASKGWKRGLGTGAMFLGLILTVSTFIGLMVPLIVDQVKLLVDRLPEYIDQLSAFAARFGIDFAGTNLSNAAGEVGGDLSSFSRNIAGNIFGVGQTLLNTVFQLLTIGLFTFYMTAEGPRLRRTVCSMLPHHRQLEVLRIWDIAIDKTGAYFYTRTLLAGISAALGWVVFMAIGLDFPLALALWMAIISQFVPVVGTYLGGALPLLIALLDSPTKALAVVIYVIVYQQIENYLLAPKLTARTMSLHPAVSFGSAIAGGTLLGVPGALMALPVAATTQAFISTYVERYKVVDSPLTAEPPEKEEKEG